MRTGRRGTTISFKLSTPATVTLRIQRATGRGSRYRTMAGGLADRQGVQGTNTVRFNESLGGRKLRPGRYRLQVFATDAADRESAVSRIRFAVVRR